MEVDRLAKILWDYHRLDMPLSKADLIVVFGSRDTDLAKIGAKIFLQGYVPLMLMTGGLGKITKTIQKISEAETFAQIAISLGVPKEKILIENKSTNTG